MFSPLKKKNLENGNKTASLKAAYATLNYDPIWYTT